MIRPFIIAASLVLVSGCATSPTPRTQTVAPKELVRNTDVDIGYGNKIRIPADWKVETLRKPDSAEGCSYRIRGAEVEVLIEGLDGTGPRQSAPDLVEGVKQSLAEYLPRSREKGVLPSARANRGALIAHGTLSAENPKTGLKALPRERKPSILMTRVLVSKDEASYTVTVASFNSNAIASYSYQAAMQAVLEID